MSQETLMILKMLEEGKITWEEAEQLLVSLSGKEKSRNKAQKPAPEIIEDEITVLLREARDLGKETVRVIKDSVRLAMEESKEALIQVSLDELGRRKEYLKGTDATLVEEYARAEKLLKKASSHKAEMQSLAKEISQFEVEDAGEALTEMKSRYASMQEDYKLLAQEAEDSMLAVHGKMKEKRIPTDYLKPPQDLTEAADGDDLVDYISRAIRTTVPVFGELLKSVSYEGQEYEFTEERLWYPEAADEKEIFNIKLQNGGIIFYTDESAEGYKIRITKKLRAKSEEEAERIAEENLFVRRGGNIFGIEASRLFSNRNSVKVEVVVPAERLTDCNLELTNGTVKLDGIQADKILISAANGSVIVKDIKTQEMRIGTINGSIRSQAIFTEQHLSTTNGSIRAYVEDGSEGKLEINTVNGSVRVYMPRKLSSELKLSSGVGSIKLTEGIWDILRNVRRKAGSTVTAVNRGVAYGQAQLAVRAYTGSGSIRIRDKDETDLDD